MMNPNDVYQRPPRRRPGIPITFVVGVGVLLVGGVLSFGYVQWQSQKAQLAQMAQILEEMQAANQNEVVTRNAPVELAPIAPTPVALPVAVPEPEVTVAIAPVEPIFYETPLEMLSAAVSGVDKLVAAAVAGEYLVVRQGGGADGSRGQLGIVFPSHVKEQAQLEQLLATSATEGTLPYSEAVKGSDGSFDGRIILFHLIETALLSGDDIERHAGIQIRLKAIAMLSNNTPETTASVNNLDERLYTVQPGDSLAYIALQFFGNTSDYRKIYYANSDTVSSPDSLQVGQQIRIPII